MRVVTDLVLENNSLLASHLLLLQTQNITTIQRRTKTLIMTLRQDCWFLFRQPSLLTVRPTVRPSISMGLNATLMAFALLRWLGKQVGLGRIKMFAFFNNQMIVGSNNYRFGGGGFLSLEKSSLNFFISWWCLDRHLCCIKSHAKYTWYSTLNFTEQALPSTRSYVPLKQDKSSTLV